MRLIVDLDVFSGRVMQFSSHLKMPLQSTVATATWQTILWRVLAVLVIVAMLAKWTWLLFAPAGEYVLPAIQAGSADQAAHLFGTAAVSGVRAAMPNVKLVGVFAPDFAVLELDGKRQMGLAVGQEIVAGSKLVEVAIDHVVIEHGGVRQKMALEGNTSAIKSAQAATVLPVTPVAKPAAAIRD